MSIVLIEGQHLATDPTLADGAKAPIAVDDKGRLRVVPEGGGSSGASGSTLTPAQHRASVALISGDWSSQAAFAIPAGVKRVGFSVSYTGGASGGQVKYRFLKGFSSTIAAMGTEQITPGDVTIEGITGEKDVADEVSFRQVSGTALTIFCPGPYDVEGGYTHCVLQVAEAGDTGTPGTAGITVSGSY